MDKESFVKVIRFALDVYMGRVRFDDTDNEQQHHIQLGELQIDLKASVYSDRKIITREYCITKGDHILCRFILGQSLMLFSKGMLLFRKQVLSESPISGIATLKKNFDERIMVPAAIIFLASTCGKKIWLSSAASFDELWNLFNRDVNQQRQVFHVDSLTSECFAPEFYNGIEIESARHYPVQETKRLSEIAEIICGKTASKEQLGSSGIPYLRARCICDNKIQCDQVYVLPEYVSKFSRQLLQSGDILLTKFFGQNKLAVVTDDDLPGIASNGLFIIRPYDVSEGYLFKYLTSKTGSSIFSQQLNHITHGATILSITAKDLSTLPVPIYDEEMMKTFETQEPVNNHQMLSVVRVINQRASKNDGMMLEREVYDNFQNQGWAQYEIKGSHVYVSDNSRTFFDYCYVLGQYTVYVEIKASSLHWARHKTKAIMDLLMTASNTIIILTTGSYFEIHKAGSSGVLKLTHTPKPDEVISWLREVD